MMTNEESGKRILIIDDDIMACEMMTLMLEGKGFEVRYSLSLFGAVNEIERSLPDIILLDLDLPGGTGWELLLSLREDEKTRKIPVLLITNRVNAENDEPLVREADGIVTRPLEPEKLIPAIANLTKEEWRARELVR